MSKDRDYIKAMFDSDGIKAPESLSEENMLAMLEAAEAAEAKEAEQQAKWEPAKPAAGKKRASWKPYLSRWAAVAAAAVIALFGISGLFEAMNSTHSGVRVRSIRSSGAWIQVSASGA